MVDGFFLNNQLTDFSWNPANGPVPAANAIAGGKRPRSSMTPAILLDRDGNFVGAIGSPGGSSIPAYIAKTLVGLVYWDLPLQQAVDLPNLVARGKRFNGRSEEHTSELQSLMRISYAVFCLKKKTSTKNIYQSTCVNLNPLSIETH